MSNQVIKEFLELCCIVDTESTGIDPTKAEICEIGVAHYDAKSHSWKTQDHMYGTDEPIPFAASNKNNISRKMLKDLPKIYESLEQASEMIDIKNRKYFVAHNFRYDKTILHKAFLDLNHANRSLLLNRDGDEMWICTFRLAKQLLKHMEESDGELSYAQNYLRYALDLDCDGLDVHRAGSDAFVCGRLLEYLAEFVLTEYNAQFETGEELGDFLWELTNAPIEYETFPFGKYKDQLLTEIPDNYYSWALENMDMLDENNFNCNRDLLFSIQKVLSDRHGI